MGLVFFGLIAVNIYCFWYRHGTSLRALARKAEQAQKTFHASTAPLGTVPALPAAIGQGLHVAAPAHKTAALAVDETDIAEGRSEIAESTTVFLRRLGVGSRQSVDWSLQLSKVCALKSVAEGQYYRLSRVPLGLEIEVQGGLCHIDVAGAALESRGTTDHVELGFLLSGSMAEALERAGALDLLRPLTELFASELDFYTDLQKGDRFKLVVERQIRSNKARHVRIVAAEYQARGSARALRAFWFLPRQGEGRYYTEHGENLSRRELRSPLEYARNVGIRIRPVTRSVGGLLGTDLAAPRASVWAVANGKITALREAPQGFTLVLTAADGDEFTFAKITKLARGIAVGQTVRQGQRLGATGDVPMWYAHKHQDASVPWHAGRSPREAPLPSRYRDEFVDLVVPRLQALTTIESKEGTDFRN